METSPHYLMKNIILEKENRIRIRRPLDTLLTFFSYTLLVTLLIFIILVCLELWAMIWEETFQVSELSLTVINDYNTKHLSHIEHFQVQALHFFCSSTPLPVPVLLH